MSRSQKDLEAAYPVGREVTCVVGKFEPFGVFVWVADDPVVGGLIRPREWTWMRREFDPARDASRGERIQARVLGYKGFSLALSRRLALPDPYPEFKTRHKVGDVVRGQVEFVARKEAGVQLSLEEGVEGFVPRSELPDFALGREGFGLLAQDWLVARIVRFQEAEVTLSIKEYLRSRARADVAARSRNQSALRYHPTVGVVLEDLSLTLQLQELPEPEIATVIRESIRKILVVEDNANVSESLKMVFDHFGFPCDLADSARKARSHIRKHSYDLVILDINLPTEKGTSLVGDLALLAKPPFVFALSGAPEQDWSALSDLDPRLVVGIFQKPTNFLRILERLAQVLEERKGPADDRSERAGFGVGLYSEEGLSPWAGRKARKRRPGLIERRLADLKAVTNASKAFVLSYRPGPVFELVAGEFAELTREAQQNLDVSPIENVLHRHALINVPDVSARESLFQHLVNVHPLGAFAGCPLDYSDQAEYGLFLLGEQPKQLREISEERLRSAATSIGHLLAEERLDAVITENQGLLLTGFLADSLLHEIKNAVQAMDSFSAIQVGLAKRHLTDFGSMSPEEIVEFKKATLGIQGGTSQLKDLIRLFRNLVGEAKVEEVDLNQTVRRLLDSLRPFADDKEVILLDPQLDDTLPEIRLKPKLLDQALLNVMINAVEQMAMAGGGRRVLRVATRYQPGSEYPVLIMISDTGPGIHFVHQERIFDLFFTTKDRGTGLGLYISRHFVEQLGGRLRLGESLRFVGSTFLIELPGETL